MRSARPGLHALVIAALLAGGCARAPRAARTSVTWLAGHPAPAFDPGGVPDPLRWSLERLLSRGLVDEDEAGRIVPAAAAAWSWSADGRRLTFHLRRDLRFVDGTRCGSGDFARALRAGLARHDHASNAWLLRAVSGVAFGAARGRAANEPALRTPDDSTLVIQLSRPDSLLLQALALPGVCTPWAAGGGDWAHARGLGPCRVLSVDGPPASPRGLVLLRQVAAEGPDTIRVRFQPAPTRVLALLRSGAPDLVWPAPAALWRALLPAGYTRASAGARPARRLLLVMRHDLPPTSRAVARQALALGIRPGGVADALGTLGRPTGDWVAGAGERAPAGSDAEGARALLASQGLERSFHAVMTYDPSGEGALVARVLQAQWSTLGIDVELEPVRGMPAGGCWPGRDAHLALVAGAALEPGPEGELMRVAEPPAGPQVGEIATGWRIQTSGLDRADPSRLQRLVDAEGVAVPLADLPWWWIERQGAHSTWFHPRYGPECVRMPTSPGARLSN